MPKRKKAAKEPKNLLDTISRKKGRGRPGVRKTDIAGRSYNLGIQLDQIWNWAGEGLIKAKTEEEALAVLSHDHYYRNQLEYLAPLIPKVTRDPDFPKARQARINFLADSLAGVGAVSFRRSRDICAEMRALHKKKTKHKILRREYYIECSCGYEGPAKNDACPECSAEIAASFNLIYPGFR